MLVQSGNLELPMEVAFAKPKYTILMNHDTVELGDEQVVRCKALNKSNGETFDIPATGFFVAIGHKPNTDILKILSH
jgi:thioredoxin reductase